MSMTSAIQRVNRLNGHLNNLLTTPFNDSIFKWTEDQMTEAWNPRLEWGDTEEGFQVRVELPGLEISDVEVKSQDGTLEITGEKKAQQSKTYYSNMSYGKFKHTVSLPRATNPTEARATMKNGVLEVTIPYSEEKKPRRIEITE